MNDRHWRAVVLQVGILWSFSVLIFVCHKAKSVADPLWNVKPVQLRMTDRRRAAVKSPCVADKSNVAPRTRSACPLWSLRLSQQDVAIVNAAGRHETRRSLGNAGLEHLTQAVKAPFPRFRAVIVIFSQLSVDVYGVLRAFINK